MMWPRIMGTFLQTSSNASLVPTYRAIRTSSKFVLRDSGKILRSGKPLTPRLFGSSRAVNNCYRNSLTFAGTCGSEISNTLRATTGSWL